MSMNYIVNEDCKIETVSPVMGGTIKIKTSSKSDLMKINDKGVYAGTIECELSGSTYNGLNQVENVTIKIKPETAKLNTKSKLGGDLLLVEGDFGNSDAVVKFNKGQSSASTVVTLKITSAGQTKVRCK